MPYDPLYSFESAPHSGEISAGSMLIGTHYWRVHGHHSV